MSEGEGGMIKALSLKASQEDLDKFTEMKASQAQLDSMAELIIEINQLV